MVYTSDVREKRTDLKDTTFKSTRNTKMKNQFEKLFADIPRSKVISVLEENGMFQCCFCAETFNGFGNNPEPACMDKDERCCNDCNMMKVIPSRMQAFTKPA